MEIEALRAPMQARLLAEQPNPNIKFLLNYPMIDVDRLNPAGPGNTTPFGADAATLANQSTG